MPRIVYISHLGEETTVDVPNGLSVMEGAVRNGVDGIDADCGGACACGTCRVVIPENWRARLMAPEDTEVEMIDALGDSVDDGIRLSCQINVSADLDGMIVTMPENQQREY